LGKHWAANDEIPDYVAKKYVEANKKIICLFRFWYLFKHIYMLRIATVKPLYTKR
jgi:hypothetical protein